MERTLPSSMKDVIYQKTSNIFKALKELWISIPQNIRQSLFTVLA